MQVSSGKRKPWSRYKDSSYYMEESWHRGEPEMRPDFGRIVLARTAGMADLEESYRGHALFATAEGQVRVTAAALKAAMKLECGVNDTAVKVEVTSPPYHFFVRFDSDEDCSRIDLASRQLRCGGTRIIFRRWTRHGRGVPGKMEYKCTMSFEGLPEEAQEPQALNLVLAALDGELIEMLPARDRWIVPVSAWLRDPCAVPKQLNVMVPGPDLRPTSPGSSGEGESPPPPYSPRFKGNQNYPLIVHMKDVLDRGELLTEGVPLAYLPDSDEDLSRIHTFETWRGKVDGTGVGGNGIA